MSALDFGDVPTWVAGIFAFGAAYYARATITSQRQQIAEQREFIGEQSMNLRLERRELQAQAQARREEQARGLQFEVLDQSARLHNQTVEPIHQVSCYLGEALSTRARALTSSGFPGGEVILVPSGDPLDMPIEIVGAGKAVGFARPTDTREVMRVTFADNAGVVWELDEHGALNEVPPST